MTNTSRFWIELDNSSRCYMPGEHLSGSVIVNFTSEKTVKSIVIKIVGQAEVHWTERYRSQGSWKTRHYRAVKTYFHTKMNVVENATVPAGPQCYRFSYILPTNIPTSFNGIHGIVIYKVEGVVKRSWRFDNRVKIPFTVNGILDLNLIAVPRVSEPVDERSHQFSALCTRSGLVGFHLHIPKRGFVPGESILFTAELTNDSSRHVENVKAYFLQKITYRAQGHARRQEIILCKVQGPSIDSGERETWHGDIRIPPVPPTNLALGSECIIINVNYEFKITMDLPRVCWTSKIKKQLPITIGTIPLRQPFQPINPNQTHFVLYPPPPTDRNLWQVPTEPTVFTNAYPDIPPPSYEECMTTAPFLRPSSCPGRDSDSDNEARETNDESGPSAPNADDNFIPKYLTYSFPPPPYTPYANK